MSDLGDTVDAIIGWASQRPPMPRSEFRARCTYLLGRMERRTRLTPEEHAMIRREMQSCVTHGGGRIRRPRGAVKAICERWGISRQYLYQIAHADE